MSFIEIKNVTRKHGKINALSGASLNLEEGEQYAIRGTSGSGKSTLLYLLGGLDKPTSGELLVSGRNLAAMNDETLAKYRNNFVGFVFQFHFLLPSLNCIDNILLPSQIGGKSTKEVHKFALELSEILGVEHCLEKYPFELSGGEQQRINIIRALSLKPHLLLCDEPTGNLDSENSQIVTSLLKELSHKYSSTLVVVTHDGSVAEQFKHQIQMKDGRIESRYESGALSPSSYS